jgi:LysM repeat protein
MRLTPLIAACLLCGSMSAQKPATNKSSQPSASPTSTSKPTSSSTAGQSIVKLTNKDTLWLTVEQGEKVIHHMVKPKETLFSLAKFYSLSLEELYEYNSTFQTDPVLRAGGFVRIPIPNKAIKRYKIPGFVNSKHAVICYVVQPGDNLYQICKRNFDMPVDTILKRNKLKNNNIQPGQAIHMGWMGVEGIPLEWRKSKVPTANDVLGAQFGQQKVKYKEVSSQGICHWNPDNSEKGDLYALHREAAIGTIISVTNPANKSTTFAKVIGRIPPNLPNHVEVVLSPAAAKRLGAKQNEFMSRVKFLK